MNKALAQAAYDKLRLGDPAGAEKLLSPIIAANPNNASFLQLMGIICQSQNKFDDAIRYMRQAIKYEPNNAQYHNNLGVTLQAQGQVTDAAQSFRQAIRCDPNFVSAHVGLTRTLMTQGAEEAVDAARGLTAIDQSAQAWDLRAAAERGAGRFPEALISSENAIRAAPQNPVFRPGRALALEQVGRNAEALAEWDGLSRSGARSSELAAHYARALSYAGRDDDAEAVLREAVRQWPADPAVHRQLARLRWLKGAREDFTAPLEEAVRQHPGDGPLRAEGAQLLQQAGYLDRAETLLREGIARAPNDPALVRMLTAVLTEQGRLSEALALIDAHPDFGLRGDRAVLLMRLGRAGEALDELNALPRGPSGGEQLVALKAIALRLLGDPEFYRLYDYESLVRTYDVIPPFGTTEEFNAKLAESLRALHAHAQHPLDQTLRNGTQTGRDLRHVEDPVVQAFLKALDAPIRAYMDALAPDGPLTPRRRSGYRIAGAWSVRLRPGGFHINHVHDRGWISSAYYVELPAETTEGDTQEGWIKFGEPPWPLPGCGPEKIIQPHVGMLALFPSYMLHGTIPFTHGAERLTAAFDVVPD